MMAQIYIFLLESVFIEFNLVAFLFGVERISAFSKDIATTYKMLEFAALSVAHCLLGPMLKNFFLRDLLIGQIS
jgi:hypothetical protein